MELRPYKFVLVLTNFCILSFLLVLLIDHYNGNHNFTSYSSIFHCMTFLWLSIRGVFWLLTLTSTSSWSSFTFYFLYWMPNPLEFGSFMLLPLFFAQIIYPSEWQHYWIYIRPVYISAILGLIVFQSMWAVITAYLINSSCKENYKDEKTLSMCYHTSDTSNLFRLVSSTSFILLAIVQTLYAYKLYFMDNIQYKRYMISSRSLISVVNGILAFSFLTRGLYQLVSIFGLLRLPNIPLQNDEDVHYIILICFALWDYIPVILVITTVTSRAIGNNAYYSNSILQASSSSQAMKKRANRKPGEQQTHAGAVNRTGKSFIYDGQRSKCASRGGALASAAQILPCDEETALLSTSNLDSNSGFGSFASSTVGSSCDQKSNSFTGVILQQSFDSHKSDNQNQCGQPISSMGLGPGVVGCESREHSPNSLHSIHKDNDKDKDDYYEDEIDPCSLERFSALSLSAISGNSYRTTNSADEYIRNSNSSSIYNPGGYLGHGDMNTGNINTNNTSSSVPRSLESCTGTSDSVASMSRNNLKTLEFDYAAGQYMGMGMHVSIGVGIGVVDTSTETLTNMLGFYRRRRGSSIGSSNSEDLRDNRDDKVKKPVPIPMTRGPAAVMHTVVHTASTTSGTLSTTASTEGKPAKIVSEQTLTSRNYTSSTSNNNVINSSQQQRKPVPKLNLLHNHKAMVELDDQMREVLDWSPR